MGGSDWVLICSSDNHIKLSTMHKIKYINYRKNQVFSLLLTVQRQGTNQSCLSLCIIYFIFKISYLRCQSFWHLTTWKYSLLLPFSGLPLLFKSLLAAQSLSLVSHVEFSYLFSKWLMNVLSKEKGHFTFLLIF